MPISSPRPTRNRSAVRLCIAVLLAALPVGARPAHAQTLAHPNWVGNNMSTDPWWQHAVLYRVSEPAAFIDFSDYAKRVNALRTLGADAILLPAPPIPQNSADAAAGQAAAGKDQIDDLDTLIREGSSRGLRVLLTLTPALPGQDLTGAARFFLSRGAAGLYIATPPGQTAAEMQPVVLAVRRVAASVVGQRIVLADSDPLPAATADSQQPAAPIVRRSPAVRQSTTPRSTDTAPLLEFERLPSGALPTAATLRPLLAQSAGQANTLVEFAPPAASQTPAKQQSLPQALAAVALLTHPTGVIDSSAHLQLDPAADHPELAEDGAAAKPPPPPPPSDVYMPFKPYVPASKPKTAEEARMIPRRTGTVSSPHCITATPPSVAAIPSFSISTARTPWSGYRAPSAPRPRFRHPSSQSSTCPARPFSFLWPAHSRPWVFAATICARCSAQITSLARRTSALFPCRHTASTLVKSTASAADRPSHRKRRPDPPAPFRQIR
jgi:hypothetical protein